MNIIEEKIAALVDFKNSINDTIFMTISDIEDIIIKLNTDSQLFEEGINSEGIKIDSFKPYTARTINIKREKGQPTNRVTLRDTESFHKSFDVIVYEDRFEIVANDFKTEKLISKYGESIIGLTEHNINTIIWDYIYTNLISVRDSLL